MHNEFLDFFAWVLKVCHVALVNQSWGKVVGSSKNVLNAWVSIRNFLLVENHFIWKFE